MADKFQRYRQRKALMNEVARSLTAVIGNPTPLAEGHLRTYLMNLTRFYFAVLKPEQLEKLQQRHDIPVIDPRAADWEEDIAPLQPQLDLFTELPAK